MAAKHNPRDCVARYGDCGGCDETVPRRGAPANSVARPRTITIPPKEVAHLVEPSKVDVVERVEGSYHELSIVEVPPEPPTPVAAEPIRTEVVQVTGHNHLPAEMAARMLEQSSERRYQDPTPEQDEACTLLAEECAEAIQRATKIQRFGLGARPGDTITNVRALSEELGHVQAAIDLAVQHGLADSRYILLARARKLEEYSRAPDAGGVTRRQSIGVRKSIALMARILFDRMTNAQHKRRTNRPEHPGPNAQK